MRIVSYNILDGGEGRADPLAEVIIAQRPDVVVLIEADQLPVVERIAGRLKMDFVHAPGGEHAGAILSRFPIRDSINHAALTDQLKNSFVEATIIAHDGEWTVCGLHLTAHAREENERERERELDFILDHLASHRSSHRRHLIAGDFNANAPYQRIDISKTKPRTQEDAKANGGQIPRRVIQKMLDAAYVETLRAVDREGSETGGTFSTQFPGQRVDYIFTHGVDPNSIRSAWIEHDRLAKYASDHFPVGAEIV